MAYQLIVQYANSPTDETTYTSKENALNSFSRLTSSISNDIMGVFDHINYVEVLDTESGESEARYTRQEEGV